MYLKRTLILNIEDLQVPTNFREYFGTIDAMVRSQYIHTSLLDLLLLVLWKEIFI